MTGSKNVKNVTLNKPTFWIVGLRDNSIVPLGKAFVEQDRVSRW